MKVEESDSFCNTDDSDDHDGGAEDVKDVIEYWNENFEILKFFNQNYVM